MEPVRTEERPRAIPSPAVTISSLIKKVSAYGPEGAEELLADAYAVAHAAHRGQVRKSGEPFVYHPLATADILAELRLDPTTIAAAVLHDVLEDTGVTKEELASRFGSELAEIVDGVTKLKRLPSGNLEEAQAESLRKTKAHTVARRLIGWEPGVPGREEEVAAPMLRQGDVVVVEAGQVIPGDGDVMEGIASVDESAITGESAPVIRESGGDRSAGRTPVHQRPSIHVWSDTRSSPSAYLGRTDSRSRLHTA